ncbi:MAG: 16S rRNA (guanine(966)-N(2))-methyltransferase RsmD [Candidatus Omnitrophica bacterium]|nr:16S rRNA (guanine(966)-N(2))-methyltransferase RsmD [Candidatus Omnitrophota bacterium]
MRITTGKYKGRSLKMPKGIRPTQDKVRKAIFDILGDIAGLTFLELFAGSGAVGLEALSRGAKGVVLVEANPESILTIKENLAILKPENCILYPSDTQRIIENLHKSRKTFDIIFFDPPYYQDLAKKTLQTLEAYDILAPDGLIIAQHFKRENLPENLGVLSLIRQYKYSDTFLSLYRKKEP